MEKFLNILPQDDLSISTTLINLLIGLVLSLILNFHFNKFSSTLSGKKELSRIMPFLILIVCLIISIVKSSLALSLGLVGALSIVRFRTPIKEPEELVYLFMCIAIGLGLGANQPGITIIASLFILLTTAIFKWKFNKEGTKNLYLSLTWTEDTNTPINTEELSQLISEHIKKIDLKRYDTQDNQNQLVFFLDIPSQDKIFELKNMFKEKFPHISSTFIDQSRIPGI